jgi:hypothetical protein
MPQPKIQIFGEGENRMRMLLRVSIPVEAAYHKMRNGQPWHLRGPDILP